MTLEQREKRNAYMRVWNARNRDKVRAGKRAYYYRRQEDLKVRNRAQHYRIKYGITVADRERMIREQGGSCLVCVRPFKNHNAAAHIDHCHTSGKIRGVLCGPCNGKLGWYERYKAAIETHVLRGHQ